MILLTPEDRFRDRSVHNEQRAALYRALACTAIGRMRNTTADIVLRSMWPQDDAARILVRAPTSPLDRTGYPQLTAIRLLPLIAPKSAAAQLFERCVRLDFAGINSISVPNAIELSAGSLFIAEGQPISVSQALLSAALLGPVKKMAFIAGVTDELMAQSPDNASALIGRLMSQGASRGLDRQVFGTAAATAAAPAGLLNGVTVTQPGASMSADLSALIGAIADAGVVGDIALIMHPARALTLTLMSFGVLPNAVLTSSQIPRNRIIAVGLDAVASGYDGVPVIEASKGAAVNFADPALAINAGTPASPVKSALQDGLTLLKLRLACCWGPVQPGAVQYVDVTW